MQNVVIDRIYATGIMKRISCDILYFEGGQGKQVCGRVQYLFHCIYKIRLQENNAILIYFLYLETGSVTNISETALFESKLVSVSSAYLN